LESAKALDQLTPADLWREVREEGSVWSDMVERFHQSPLSDDVLYRLFDGVNMRVEEAVGVKRRLVLWACATTVEGKPARGRFRRSGCREGDSSRR
jgi:hypothetical protein